MDSSDEDKLLAALESGDFQTALQLLPKDSPSPPTVGPDKLTPLHYACQHGRPDIALLLITEYNYSINSRSSAGQTPLHFAAKHGQLDVMKSCVIQPPEHTRTGSNNANAVSPSSLTELASAQLLQHEVPSLSGADINGNTPLHLAVTHGHFHLARYLIHDAHCNPAPINNEKLTPLHLAAMHGHLEVVQYLVEEEGCDPSARDEQGRTPLYLAAGSGQLEVVKYLTTEKQCDPNCRTIKSQKETKSERIRYTFASGRTPLHAASQAGHLRVVQYLIDELNCSPSCTDDDGRTPLYVASRDGQILIIKFLTEEKRCDSLCTTTLGSIPLHGASLGGSLEVVKFFISEKGCDPMCRGQWGRTPLHYASQKGHLEIVKYLIDEQHVDPSCLDEERAVTPLHLASSSGHLTVVKFLTEEKHVDPSCLDEDDAITPLHLASSSGHLTVVKFLTEEKHCDPLCRDKFGYTPLHNAALRGRLEVVKFFISEKGCDSMCRGWQGRTPLHYASEKGHLEIVKYLIDEQHVDPSCLDKERAVTPLHLASRLGHLAVVKFLTEEKHCDPLCRDKFRYTPLHNAALRGRLAVVKFFISEKGCDPMCRGWQGRTPLHYASEEGHLEMVKYLIDEQRVDPSCLDKDNAITPLHLASKNGHLAVVKFLTEEKHCDPLCRDKFGYTPLHNAALRGSLEVVKFFISEKGCDSMCRGWQGRTPLHYASEEGHLEIVKYLIDEQHADASYPDGYNVTPLHMASLYGHLDVVKYLVDCKHCDPAVQTKLYETPVDLAIRNKHKDIVQYLLSKGGTPSRYVLQKGVGISPLVKIHVVGNSGSGKSSLVKALQDEGSPIAGQFFNVSGVIPKTSGIIPVELDSKHYGKVTFYDFAGHEEYYAGHEAIFESTSLPIVLLTVNLSDPSHKIRKAIGYWESLIGNAVSSSVHVIAIGSHSDALSAQDLQTKSAILSEAMESPSIFKDIRHAGWVTLDCRKSSSAGISKLRQCLQHVCKSVRIEADFDYKNAAVLNEVLNKQLKACTFTELLTGILESGDPNLEQLKSPPFLFQTCESLNKSGYVLFLSNKESPEESWLILNKKAILSDVHGLLKQVKLSSTSGIVTASQLKGILQRYGVGLHIDLVRRYLIQMEFCIKVELNLFELVGGSNPHKKSECFLFPEVLSERRPDDVWQPNPQFTYYFGWGLKCTESSHFFTPRFLQVLLIHLASRFALNPNPESPGLLEPAQGCRLWKNGIRWQDGKGIETIVEISDQNTVLNVMMRCPNNSKIRSIQTRSSIIREVLSTKDHICPKVNPKEYLIHPDYLQHYPLTEATELPMNQIVDAIIRNDTYLVIDSPNDSNPVPIGDLLHFEPYQNFSMQLLQQLFDEQNAGKAIPTASLYVIAEALQSNWCVLEDLPHVSEEVIAQVKMDSTMNGAQKCFHILTISSEKDSRSYGTLRQILDQYSIYAGRNPLAISSHLVTRDISTAAAPEAAAVLFN